MGVDDPAPSFMGGSQPVVVSMGQVEQDMGGVRQGSTDRISDGSYAADGGPRWATHCGLPADQFDEYARDH